MIPYRLLFISERKPDYPDEIICSNQMIGWGLWRALSNLPHVSLTYRNCEPGRDPVGWRIAIDSIPEVDFTIIHSYTPGSIFEHMPFIRSKTARKMMWISENTYYDFDHCFTFLPYGAVRRVPSMENVPLPCLKDVLAENIRQPRVPGSILLDHAYNMDKDWLWCEKFYEWLAPTGRMVGQMEREDHERLAGLVIPDWINKVPNTYYLEYLSLTSPYENYVMTHPGSYEHSIIDMVARGIRVLVPVKDGNSFAPLALVRDLGLPMFSDREEFFSILDEPHDGRDEKIDACMGMGAIAAE